MASTLLRRQIAVFATFFVPGLCMAMWITRTPAIRDAIGASTGEMGLVLFGLSVGSMIGVLSSATAVARFGARPAIIIGMILVLLGLIGIGAGAFLGLPLVVTLGLGVLGLGMGVAR